MTRKKSSWFKKATHILVHLCTSFFIEPTFFELIIRIAKLQDNTSNVSIVLQGIHKDLNNSISGLFLDWKQCPSCHSFDRSGSRICEDTPITDVFGGIFFSISIIHYWLKRAEIPSNPQQIFIKYNYIGMRHALFSTPPRWRDGALWGGLIVSWDVEFGIKIRESEVSTLDGTQALEFL